MVEGGEGPEGDPAAARLGAVSRRHLLGGGLIGAAGLMISPLLLEPGGGDGTGAGALGLVAGTVGSGSAAAAEERPGPPDALRVAGLASPLGLAADDIFFAWQVRDGRRRARQGAYRIEVTGPVGGHGPAPVVWDSGRVTSAEQAFVPYAGTPLSSDAAYRWTVRTWDGSGQEGPPSAPAPFETGLRNDEWEASWITRPASETAEPCQYTYARAEVTLRPGTDPSGPGLRLGGPAVRALRERRPGRQGPGLQLSGLHVLRGARPDRAPAARGGERLRHGDQLAGPDQGPPGRPARG